MAINQCVLKAYAKKSLDHRAGQLIGTSLRNSSLIQEKRLLFQKKLSLAFDYKAFFNGKQKFLANNGACNGVY